MPDLKFTQGAIEVGESISESDLKYTQGAIEVGQPVSETDLKYTQGAIEIGIFEYNNLIFTQGAIEVGFPGPSWFVKGKFYTDSAHPKGTTFSW